MLPRRLSNTKLGAKSLLTRLRVRTIRMRAKGKQSLIQPTTRQKRLRHRYTRPLSGTTNSQQSQFLQPRQTKRRRPRPTNGTNLLSDDRRLNTPLLQSNFGILRMSHITINIRKQIVIIRRGVP